MKKLLTYLLSMVMVAALAIGGTLAYLNDEDSDVNVMTMGNVYIEQLEYERDKDGNLVVFKDDNKSLFPAVYDLNDFGQEGFFSNNVQEWSSIGSQGENELFNNSITNVLDKFVFVKNIGTTNAYVRNIFAFELGESNPKELFEEIIKININIDNWDWEGIDTVSMDGTNYYIVTATYKGTDTTHFNGELTPNGVTCPSLLQVMMYNTVENEDIKQFGDDYKILVVSQAVQSKGFDGLSTYNLETSSVNANNALNTAFGEISATNHPWNASIEEDTDGAIVLNNNILTLSNFEEPLKIKGNGTVILDGANISAEDGAAISVLSGSKVKLEVLDNAMLKGATGASAISVGKGATLELTGNGEVVAIGNDGVDSSAGGHGIGGAGTIHIHDLNSLTAKGFGLNGFGIGGESKNITIENTTIKQVQGGYKQQHLETDKGKQDKTGGAAIGSSTNGAVIDINNVTILEAYGGSKAAGIGGQYWTGVTININNSTINKVVGGGASAAIGGSRVNSENSANQNNYINILDSKIVAIGGEYGAGIGSGYDVYCHSGDKMSTTTIFIKGNSVIEATGGKYSAAIGTGFHVGGLKGAIDSSVILNVHELSTQDSVYKPEYTKAMNIGFGVVDPGREANNQNTSSFNNQGTVITVQDALNTLNK